MLCLCLPSCRGSNQRECGRRISQLRGCLLQRGIIKKGHAWDTFKSLREREWTWRRFPQNDVAMLTYVLHLFHICVTYDSRWFTYVWRDACLMRQLCHTCLTVGDQCEHVNMCPHVSTFNGTAHSICRPQHRRLPAKAAEWLRGEAPCMKPRIACSPQLYEVMCFQCLTKGFNAFRTLRNSEEMARASLSRNLPQLATLCISHSATLSWGISAGAKRHCA